MAYHMYVLYDHDSKTTLNHNDYLIKTGKTECDDLICFILSNLKDNYDDFKSIEELKE